MTVKILVGSALDRLAELPDQSVQCCITSPPYWNLRAYTGEEGMMGLEKTFDEHVENLVKVFREVRRVLRDDGTLWMNYGDAYVGGGRGHGGLEGSKQATNAGSLKQIRSLSKGCDGLASKNLMMMPARVAIALQYDGWHLRSEIVWHKPNPMPESATDRPTMAHEKIFMFSKSRKALYWTHPEHPGCREKPAPDYIYINKKTGHFTRTEPKGFSADKEVRKQWSRRNLWRGHDYFYDHVAVRTAMKPQSIARLEQSTFDTQEGGPKDPKQGNRSHRKVLENLKTRAVPSCWENSPNYQGQDPRYPGRDEPYIAYNQDQSATANLRNVWYIPVAGYNEAHFATFPPALILPCFQAGTSKQGSCTECGAPS